MLQQGTKSCLTEWPKDTPLVADEERLTCIMFSRKKTPLSPAVTLDPCCHTSPQNCPNVASRYRVTRFFNTALQLRTQNKQQIKCLSVMVHTPPVTGISEAVRFTRKSTEPCRLGLESRLLWISSDNGFDQVT